MSINDYYEEITESEANFLIDLYEVVRDLVSRDIDVTLVRLAFELDTRPSELSDYLPQILVILNKVEEEFEIR
jgi:hypothetical protein|tara:strand:+ start:3284 stop:3502 length:219 start_codon:yes stop_codon:yes gene_type:complete